MDRQEADALVEALSDVVDESIRNLSMGLVSREEGEKHRYTQKVSWGWVGTYGARCMGAG